MYVAVVTGGNVATLPAAVSLMVRELAASGASRTLHVWVTPDATVPPGTLSACTAFAAAGGIQIAWRNVAQLLEHDDPVTRAIRKALAAALPAATRVGATRLLMKREAAGQSLVSIDDDITGLVVADGLDGPPGLSTGSHQVLLDAESTELNCVPAPAGTLLRLLDPSTLPAGLSAGPHVIQAGLLGDAGADAPVAELEYGLRLTAGEEARQVRRLTRRPWVGPLDRLMTYAWSASAAASGLFFPVAFRNAEGVWATLERLRRPAIRLVHAPVGCIHRPARVRDGRAYSAEAAVMQWRTNDWLALLCAEGAAARRHGASAADALSGETGRAWDALVDRSRRLRREVLQHRATRFEMRVGAERDGASRLRRLLTAVSREYRSADCWIPDEWRSVGDPSRLRNYVGATGRLAAACAGEL